MRLIIVTIAGLAIATSTSAQAPNQEAPVRQAVQAFYAAFNSHGFDGVAEFTTEDWNHVNPLGGRTRGRAAVLTELREVHSTFTTPDGVKHENDRWIRTFVVVKRGARWLIMQDHNTIVAP